MKKEYYVLVDAWGKLPGYPVYFDYEIDWDVHAHSESKGYLTRSKVNEIDLKVKHRKINFDYDQATGFREFFVSEALFKVFMEFSDNGLLYKKINILGVNKNSKNLYYAISFKDIKKFKYVNEKECKYVIPDIEFPEDADLIELGFHYEEISKYDILPSLFSEFYSLIIISSDLLESISKIDSNLETIPLKEAAEKIFVREKGNIYDYRSLKKYDNEELQKIRDDAL